jgi:hypothetical protein
MNKLIVTIAASLAVLGVVFAQVPGGFGGQEAPRPQGQGIRAGGNSASVAASGNYVYVVSGGTLYQFSVDGLKLVTKAQIPVTDRGGVDGAAGRGGGGGRKNNDPAN